MRFFSSSMIVAALVLAAFGASAGGFREDEIYCEEAVAQLAKCCADFAPQTIECSYIDNSTTCNPSYQYPAIDEATSKCILALDCGSLVEKGVCSRASRITPRVTDTQSSIGTALAGGSEGVCP
jgi:hypothetical protein